MMNKIFTILFIGVALAVASCQKEDEEDQCMDAYANLPNKGGQDDESQTGIVTGIYDLSWIVDNQVVDTATLDNTKAASYYTTVSHFPMVYLFSLVGKKVAPEDISYQAGISDWKIAETTVGYSESNVYLRNSIWAPQVMFQVNGEDYSLLIFMNEEENTANWYTTMMYDWVNDKWIGATPIYKFQLTNMVTNESWSRSFTKPVDMMFQTTGRRK